jgi:hypothetical protein
VFAGKKRKQLEERLLRDGTFVRGEITAVKQHHLQNKRNTFTWDVTARFVTTEGRSVESTQTFDFLEWASPAVGKPATLRYDPAEPEQWAWEDHPPDLDAGVQVVNVSGADAQAKIAAVRDQGLITQQQYEQAVAQLGGAAPQPGDPVESRLERLKQLHADGTLDDAEYAQQRQRIIESL